MERCDHRSLRRKDRNAAADKAEWHKKRSHRRTHRGGGREAGRGGHARCDLRVRARVVWMEKRVISTRLRYSPQRVARLGEIKERPGISERLVVFSVHTSKVAYQGWCGTDWPFIIGQCTVEFIHRLCDGFSKCCSFCLTFRQEEHDETPGTHDISHTSVSTPVLEYRSLALQKPKISGLAW